MSRLFLSTLFGLGVVFTSCTTKTQTETLSPKEAEQIAREAYIFAYPMLMGYQAHTIPLCLRARVIAVL